jgi:hypothetical protein
LFSAPELALRWLQLIAARPKNYVTFESDEKLFLGDKREEESGEEKKEISAVRLACTK